MTIKLNLKTTASFKNYSTHFFSIFNSNKMHFQKSFMTNVGVPFENIVTNAHI